MARNWATVVNHTSFQNKPWTSRLAEEPPLQLVQSVAAWASAKSTFPHRLALADARVALSNILPMQYFRSVTLCRNTSCTLDRLPSETLCKQWMFSSKYWAAVAQVWLADWLLPAACILEFLNCFSFRCCNIRNTSNPYLSGNLLSLK